MVLHFFINADFIQSLFIHSNLLRRPPETTNVSLMLTPRESHTSSECHVQNVTIPLVVEIYHLDHVDWCINHPCQHFSMNTSSTASVKFGMLAGLKYRTCPGSNLNLCLKPAVIPLTPDPFVCYQFPLSPPGCVWASVCEGDCNFQGEAGELAQWWHSPGPYTQPPFPQSSVGPPVTRTIPDRPNREKKKEGPRYGA